MSGGREPGHVRADLGEDDLGTFDADAGDLGEALRGGQARPRRSAGWPGRVVAGGLVWLPAVGGRGWLHAGDLGDKFVDPAGEPVDLAVQGVDLIEQDLRQFRV